MKKFFVSKYFNTLLAVVAAVLSVLQEVWIGTSLVFLNAFGLAALVGIGFAWIAEVIKILVSDTNGFIWNRVLFGAIFGVVAALITTLIVVL